jgi:hypothetical protein
MTADNRQISVTESGMRLVAGGGTHWTVREIPYSMLDRRSGTCLIFENEQVIRRVRTFPATWRECSDEELYALCLIF